MIARLRAYTGPLRARLLLLAASGLVPLLLMLALGLNYLVRERQAQGERVVLDISRAMATAVDTELRSIVTLLEYMGTSDELERADLRAFHQSAQRTTAQLGWRQMVLSDSEGRVLFRSTDNFGASSSVPVDPKSLAQVIERRAPLIGQVTRSPAGAWDAFAVRVPVLRGDKLVYVLTAVLPTSVIGAVLTRQKIPDSSVAAVFDQTYRRVARSRPNDSPSPSPTLQALLDRGGAQGVGRSITREGVESFTGFNRLEDSGWVIAVANSVADTHRGLYGLLGAVALGLAASLALSAMLALIASRRVVGPIEELKSGAAALGRGEPVDLPKLDIDELDEVAAALKDAAAWRDRAAAEVAQALRTAEEAGRSKDQFLAMLGHELRNPLAPIATAVHLMAMKGDGKTEAERRIIERQLVHVTRLVDDLLDVSRITGGRLEMRRQPVQLAELVAQIVHTARQSLHQRTLTLEIAGDPAHAWVAGDEVRLAQVFNNLLVNAIKFTPTGGTITVRMGITDTRVQVDVRDTGIGIAASDLPRVFELFYQSAQSADRAGGGLGLGLAIVRSLAGLHGGSVEASSDGPGTGSCFTVSLPLCEAPAADVLPPAAPAPTEAAAAASKGRVLVVDDNEDAADTSADLLEMCGYTVRVAYTPQDALALLPGFAPEVAILDIGLPGMNGYELAAAIHALPGGYAGKLVALTGYGQASDKAASKAAGFDAHLTKPVDPDALVALVEKMLSAQ